MQLLTKLHQSVFPDEKVVVLILDADAAHDQEDV
jgi:hypothetical protein